MAMIFWLLRLMLLKPPVKSFKNKLPFNGFADIVIHPRFNAGLPVTFHGVGGHGYYGDFSKPALADLFCCLQAIHFRHLDVHNNYIKIIRRCGKGFHRLSAVTGRCDCVAGLAQDQGRQFEVDRVVFCEEDFC